MKNNLQSLSSFIWSVADILRGDFKQSQYGRIILPFTVLRRLEAVLENKKDKVVSKAKTLGKLNADAREKILKKEAGHAFFNTSDLNLSKISTKDPLGDIESYLNSFSSDVREIFENFKFSEFLSELDRADLLFTVIQKFTDSKIDLSPTKISNYDMGLVFEDLIRRFAESSNETAGEHFTPRDMVRLTTSLVFLEDDEMLTKPGVIRHLYDPTCGTGGFLSSGMEYLHELNEEAQLVAFGQELNPESYAICKADMLIKGQDVSNIKLGNTLSDDQLSDKKFDYLLSNPPFGVDWKKIQKTITDEHKKKGFKGRFGPGLPRVSDGSLLFLLHLVDKMRKPIKGDQGARIGIILNGSPLFTGDAGSGESEIRRYLLEEDLVETIISLPTDMFFNTGISTYIWILTNNKSLNRKGKVQLINASNCFEKMKKTLGAKRKMLTDAQIDEIVKVFGRNEDCEIKDQDGNILIESKIFNYRDFGFRRVLIERPLKLAVYPQEKIRYEGIKSEKEFLKLTENEQSKVLMVLSRLNEKYLSRDLFLKDFTEAIKGQLKVTPAFVSMLLKYLSEHDDLAEVCKKGKKTEANNELRDFENIPLSEDVFDYFNKMVKPFAPDAWIEEAKKDEKDGMVGIVGYEINFNKYFYKNLEPRKLEDIDQELKLLTNEIVKLLGSH